MGEPSRCGHPDAEPTRNDRGGFDWVKLNNTTVPFACPLRREPTTYELTSLWLMTFVVYAGGPLPVAEQQVVKVCGSEEAAWEEVDGQGGAGFWHVYSYEPAPEGQVGETVFGNNETRVTR